MSKQAEQKISKAVIIIPVESSADVFHTRYGGETLLGRSLVVLSKSGIQQIFIIGAYGQKNKIKKTIKSIQRRLKPEIHIAEMNTGESVSDSIQSLTSQWSDAFIVLECDQIIHPTLIDQIAAHQRDFPTLFVFKEVWVENAQIRFSEKIKNKFKVMFQDIRYLPQIAVSIEERARLIQSDDPTSDADFSIVNAGAKPNEFISTKIICCRRDHLNNLPATGNLYDMIQNIRNDGKLKINWVQPAWWLPINPYLTKSQIKEFFWRIAFKEISGEFSKAVNSHLSKPMTFLLVRFRFTPNVISVIEILLFVIASSFLLIPEYWAMIVFAFIWQLSAGVLDRCDGEVARMRNYESAAGARFDMLIDDLRFAIPLLVLGYVCWNEASANWFYPAALAATFLWYIPAALFQQYYMRKAGYVSIQALGVDLLKSLDNEVPLNGFFNRFRFLLKGDIRTFYVFLLSFAGYKPILFIVLAMYEWLVGLTNIVTVQKMKRVMKEKIYSR